MIQPFEALKSNGEYAYFINCSVDTTERFLKAGLAIFATRITQPFTLYALSGEKVCKVKPSDALKSQVTGCTMADALDQVLFELQEVYI